MIYTFYSYKGGVGRSMALANVAQCLAIYGLRVVIVDWDLEAPGLESFFYRESTDLEGVRTALGVLDLLLAYKQQFPLLRPPGPDEDLGAVLAESLEPVRQLLIPVVPPRSDSSRAGVWLLPAGWRSGERFDHYARLVQGFDWEDFYANYAGAAYFDWLRSQLTAPDVADIVLIDSRTGITEMGGVCTRQLADVVVSFCAPNLQNLEGVAAMAQSFIRPDLLQARGRPLEVVAVPTRLDNSEIDARNRFEERFRASLDSLTPVAFRKAGCSFWDLRIPYIPKYAYEETLAVGGPGSRAEELETAYRNLATQLLLLAPEDQVPRGVSSRRASSGEGPVVWSVPLPANPNFVNRVAELEQLGTSLNSGGRALPVVVVHGLRATGKSALVAEYVHRHRSDYDVVWWLSARTSDRLLQDMTALGAALDLPVSETDPAGAARRWLERAGRWLLVFDDAESPGVLEGFLPTTGAGHVIVVTTRAVGWRQLGDLVAVPMLPIEESVSFLARRTGLSEGDKGLRALADALGGLPLALETAGALLEETAMSPAEYVSGLDDPNSAPTKAHASLMTMFQDLLRGLEAAAPAANDLLRLYACLEVGEVPVDLFHGVPALPDAGVDAAIKELTRSGVAALAGGALVVHPLLVRAALQSRTSTIPWADHALARVDRAFPSDVDPPDVWPNCRRLVPFALASARRVSGGAVHVRRELLPRVARYLRGQARFAEAEGALLLVPVEISTANLAAIRERGLLHLALGRYEEAASDFENLDAVALVGSVEEAEALTCTGAVQTAQGKYAEAIATLTKAVERAERAGGAEHPVLAEAFAHLGRALGELDRLAEARAALERAVRIDDALLRTTDPRRAPRLIDLGWVLAGSGSDLAGRQTIDRGRLLAEGAFGPQHPLVARALRRAGAVLARSSEAEAAMPKLVEALSIDEATFGPVHPTIGFDAMLLGSVLRDLGDEAGAHENLGRAVAVLRQTVRIEHPHFMHARDELESVGPVIAWRGRVEGAVRSGRLADALVIVGEPGDGRKAGPLRRDVAHALHAFGRLHQARQVLEEVLAHAPEDAATLCQLAKVLLELGDVSSAEARLRRAAELRRGDPEANGLLGRVDALRWRLRWQDAPDVTARRERASEWSDLAVEALASFRRAFESGPSSNQDGVEAVALEALLVDLGVLSGVSSYPSGLEVALQNVRAENAPGPLRSDRQKLSWLRATGALAELCLVAARDEDAKRLYRNIAADENVGYLEVVAIGSRLQLYGSLGFRSEVVDAALDTLESARRLAPGMGGPRFEDVVAVLGGDDRWAVADRFPDLVIVAGMSSVGIDTSIALSAGARVRLLLSLTDPRSDSNLSDILPRSEVFHAAERLGPAPAEVDPGRRTQLWALEMGRVEAEPGHLTVYVDGADESGLAQRAEQLGAKVVRASTSDE